MLFKNIIGQTKIKHRFIQSIRDGFIPNTQFIVGDSGTGSLALSLGYSRYLYCMDRQGEDSCGICLNCIKFDKLLHPDLHFVFPIFYKKEKKEIFCDDLLPLWRKFLLSTPYGGLTSWLENMEIENAQALIYSRESDKIIRKLNLKTYESEYKTVIIWLPEKMHEAAANKLLKILEEPPEKTVFLLVSEEPNSVLDTIRSRGYFSFVPPIADQDLYLILKKTYNVPVGNIQKAIRSSRGNYETAKQILSSSLINEEHLNSFRTMMLNAYLGRYQKIKLEAEKFASLSRNKQKKRLSYAQNMIRENFLYKLKEQKINYMNQKENEFSIRFHSYVNETNIIDLMEELSMAENHIEANVNPRMVFFDLSLKIARFLKKPYNKRPINLI